MDEHRFTVVTRSLTSVPSRRDLLRGLGGAGLGLGVARLPDRAEAKKEGKKTPKGRKSLCRKDGSACKKPGKQCKQQFCLRAPFTIEATWTEKDDHDTYLFVPPEDAATGPAPFINYTCSQIDSLCEAEYPFVCSSGNVGTIGAEVLTIHQLLPGTYEHWMELDDETPASGVSVVLKDSTGRVVRKWARSPANATPNRKSWHVFDFDGRHGRVTAIDELIDDRLPDGAHVPSTNVCAYKP